MTPALWCVPRATDFLWREWDADGVLYDTASGDTHRLGALHLEVLAMLQQQARSADALLESLRDDLPDHLDAPSRHAMMAGVLGELARLGLVEELPS